MPKSKQDSKYKQMEKGFEVQCSWIMKEPSFVDMLPFNFCVENLTEIKFNINRKHLKTAGPPLDKMDGDMMWKRYLKIKTDVLNHMQFAWKEVSYICHYSTQFLIG